MNQLVDQSDDRKYFITIPNLVDDMGLSPVAFRLYTHIKRVAGENGECWQSTRTLANACKVSAGSISKAKKELEASKLIHIKEKENPRGGRAYHMITIIDIWQDNMEKYSSSQDELTSSGDELASSPGELKKNPLRKTQEEDITTLSKDQRKERKPNPVWNLCVAISEVCSVNLEANKGQILRETKQLLKADATPEKVREHFGAGGWWYQYGLPPG